VVTEAWLRGLAGDPDDRFPTEAELPTRLTVVRHG
jgi:hypothetical protein